MHRIIKFNQKAWLKPHINMNTNLRKKVKTSFEKKIFKSMNNAVFGKTVRNLRLNRNIRIKLNTNTYIRTNIT